MALNAPVDASVADDYPLKHPPTGMGVSAPEGSLIRFCVIDSAVCVTGTAASGHPADLRRARSVLRVRAPSPASRFRRPSSSFSLSDQRAGEQAHLGRPGRGVGDDEHLAVVEGLRLGVRGQVGADDLGPAAEHPADRRRAAPSRGRPEGPRSPRPKSWGSPASLRGPYALRRGSRRGSCPRLAASALAWASFSLAIAAPLAAAPWPSPIRSPSPAPGPWPVPVRGS